MFTNIFLIGIVFFTIDFSDLDGSVKMVCCGEDAVINEFLDEMRYKGSQKGAEIDDIAKKEIVSEIYLPQRFLRLYTDELNGKRRSVKNSDLMMCLRN